MKRSLFVLSLLLQFLAAEISVGAPMQTGTAIRDFAIDVRTLCVVYNDGRTECDSPGNAKVIPAHVLNPTKIAVGADIACAIVKRGFFCWGEYDSAGYATDVAPTLKAQNPRELAVSQTNIPCTIDDKGVRCWYYNASAGEESVGLPPGGLLNPRALSLGYDDGCVNTDRGVKCWGTTAGIKNVPALTNVTQLSVGTRTACAVANGKVSCWGDVQDNAVISKVPTDLRNPRQVSVGQNLACVIEDRGVRCWGDGSLEQLNPPRSTSGATKLVVGKGGHSRSGIGQDTDLPCALTSKGLICWGEDAKIAEPYNIPFIGRHHASEYYKYAVSAGGLMRWGFSDSPPYHLIKPYQFNKAPEQYVALIPECFLIGTRAVCGNRVDGSPLQGAAGLSNPRNLVTGSHVSCVIDNRGVQCWDVTLSGQDYIQRFLSRVPKNLKNPRDLVLEERYAYVLTDEGLRVWTAYEDASAVPHEIKLMPSNFGKLRTVRVSGTQISRGNYNNVNSFHGCAIASGKVHCWGDNEAGQLNVPTDLVEPSHLYLSCRKSCAATAEGMRCWGMSFGERCATIHRHGNLFQLTPSL